MPSEPWKQGDAHEPDDINDIYYREIRKHNQRAMEQLKQDMIRYLFPEHATCRPSCTIGEAATYRLLADIYRMPDHEEAWADVLYALHSAAIYEDRQRTLEAQL